MECFITSMIYQMLQFFKRITSFYPEMILRLLFCFEDTQNTGLLIFNRMAFCMHMRQYGLLKCHEAFSVNCLRSLLQYLQAVFWS